MAIQDFAAIAEIIASLGVIISLLYVARQIHQTNILNRSATQQQINSGIAEVTNTVAANPELASTLAKVHFQGLLRDDASEVEKIQIGYLMSSMITQIFFMYQQMNEGVLTRKELEEWVLGGALLNKPYLASAWEVLRGPFPEDFQRWFEARYHLDRPPADWKYPVKQPARET